jgi:uncharacterized Zn finger protein (UPF0148 family)
MKDYRCPACGRLLFRYDVLAGNVQAFCKSCQRNRTLVIDHKQVTAQTSAK